MIDWGCPEQVGAWAAAVTAAVGLLTFFVILYYARIVAGQLRSQACDSLTSRLMTVNLAFVKHPSLKKFFYAEESLPTGEEDELLARLDALAGMFLDVFENYDMQSKSLPIPYRRSWASYIERMFASSPVLRQYLERNPTWYSEQIREWAERAQA